MLSNKPSAWFSRTLLLCLLLFGYETGLAASSDELELSNAVWKINISPSRLAVTAIRPNGNQVPVSLPSIPESPIQLIRKSKTQAKWTIPSRHWTIQAGLKQNQLIFQVVSSQTGDIQWPLIPLDSDTDALIWPKGEGYYIPMNHKAWTTYLLQDPWNPMEELSMPFWGVASPASVLTYIMSNPYHSRIQFSQASTGWLMQSSHRFVLSDNSCQFIICLNPDNSPVGSATQYRNWLMENHQFVSMSDKIKQTPKAERLLGAAHIYLWGDDYFTRHDVKPKQWQALCGKIIQESNQTTTSPGKKIKSYLTPELWNQLIEVSTSQWAYRYIQDQVVIGLNQVLSKPDFYDAQSLKGIVVPSTTLAILSQGTTPLSPLQQTQINAALLYAAYSDYLQPPDTWGDGVSMKMLQLFKDAGMDRLKLCVSDWSGVARKPEIAVQADELGYLFGTYDSFHSIHNPALKGTDATWNTAQFNQALYDTGAIIKADGTPMTGFGKKGYRLSPLAARPYVEERVNENLKLVPYNYYFVDCDAFGELTDDYSPLHPGTEVEDGNARVSRLKWINQQHHLVIGSEGGNAYAVPVLHTAEGIFDPNFGWGDLDLKDKKSIYYMGAYYPPDQPAVFFKPVPMKQIYRDLFYDPQLHIPLYEMVFHDSIIVTHHWSNSSLKYTDLSTSNALTELLYQVPPLYHLNLDEWAKNKGRILQQYQAFSPLHRITGQLPMTGFEWLSADHRVQKTTFGNRIELIANYGSTPLTCSSDTSIPSMAILVKDLQLGTQTIIHPAK